MGQTRAAFTAKISKFPPHNENLKSILEPELRWFDLVKST